MAALNILFAYKGDMSLSTQKDTLFLVDFKVCNIVFWSLKMPVTECRLALILQATPLGGGTYKQLTVSCI